MNVSTKWLVVGADGKVWQPPSPKKFGAYFSCAEDSDGSRFESPRRAVLWWVLFRSAIELHEIISPFQRSIRDQCIKAADNLRERIRLMGEAEGGHGTGGEVTIVVDGDGGTDTETWTSGQCDDALDGIRLAIGAIETMGEESGDDDDE